MRYNELTIEHLGDGATAATVRQFIRACERYDAQQPTDPDSDEADAQTNSIDYVWNGGQFDRRIRELLGEEVAF